MLILLLAANTSFADFPRLASFLARDRFIPRQFGDAGRSARLLQRHRHPGAGWPPSCSCSSSGDTHALIPLYAVGVFISFTLSQSSMVRRWLRLRSDGLVVAGWPQRYRRRRHRSGAC